MRWLSNWGRSTMAAIVVVVGVCNTVPSARAQVDTPAAAEARQALREVRDRYANYSEWTTWAATLNLPDVQYELLAGDRGEPNVLQAAVIELLAGRVPQFGEPPFARLAKALDVRAQELVAIPQTEWSSECNRIAEVYEPISVEELEVARKNWERLLDEFELVLPSVREPDSQWGVYLFWPESRELASPIPGPAPTHALLDRLETRWESAPTVWDDVTLFETSLAARTYIRKLRGYLAGETRTQYAEAWRVLADRLVALGADPTNTTAVAEAVIQRERLGEASQLTASIRKELSRPNLVVQLDHKWLESEFKQDLRDTYQVNDVFAGTRSVGSGQLVGTMHADILPSSAVGRWLLLFEGTSTARTSGSQDRVRVVSRATTKVAATKPFRLDARGLSPELGKAGAVTNIVYESIDSPGLPRRRSQAVRETNARRPQAERESAAYARRSILAQINEEAKKIAHDFNASYRADLRDPRIAALRPSPQIRVRANEEAIRWECLLEGPTRFGAPASPPEFSGDAKIVFNLAASAIEEQAVVDLAGRDLSGEQLLERMGRGAGGESPSSKDEFNVSFADDPCDVRYDEGVVQVRLYVTKFDSADVQYPSMTIDVSYEPIARDGKLVLVRAGRVRVRPLATGDGAPKVSGRQQTLRLAVERKLGKVFTSELEGAGLKLPLGGDEETALRVKNVRLEGPWLQVGLEPTSTAES